MLTARRATPADAALAARIIGEALAEHALPFEPEPGGRDDDVALFGARADHDDVVVEADGQPVGVASVGPQGAPGVAWVSKVFVARSARRQGAGRALMGWVEAAARTRGYREIGLRTRLVFREAIAMYESLGFARREQPDALREQGDVVYHRILG
ncbi:MAG: hypothetical protein JWP97_51 [Labilithrix sp.]|nr:hypothetical protein [Labilithrix sp.]